MHQWVRSVLCTEPKFAFWCLQKSLAWWYTYAIPVLWGTEKQSQEFSLELTDQPAQPNQRALAPVRDPHFKETTKMDSVRKDPWG